MSTIHTPCVSVSLSLWCVVLLLLYVFMCVRQNHKNSIFCLSKLIKSKWVGFSYSPNDGKFFPIMSCNIQPISSFSLYRFMLLLLVVCIYVSLCSYIMTWIDSIWWGMIKFHFSSHFSHQVSVKMLVEKILLLFLFVISINNLHPSHI